MCLAIPGQILEIVDEPNRLARVDVAGVQRNVNVGLLDGEDGGAGPGDWVLIHVGFALSKVDERRRWRRAACSSRWARSTSRSSRS
jgi:hydrogenase expression/formation protein HypC